MWRHASLSIKWALNSHALQGMLIRVDDPWPGIDDDAVKVNQDRVHGGS
jgi:hypothetical protein